ncbi:MAG: class I SAM-dependent methyltransferase [Thermoleophilaceae bacterium]|nr:class I SAM-dependent methyltransferase [Thermoleophilaceae bacterium]
MSNATAGPTAGDTPANQGSINNSQSVTEVTRGRLVDSEHLSRYVVASKLAAGRSALDVGCGSGYGTAMLAAAGATRAVGVAKKIDAFDARAVELCELLQGDQMALDFDDGSFDLVVSFEQIERCANPRAALDELARVTAAETGILLVSTANRGIYPSGNPKHQAELSADELLQSLQAKFANVLPLRQHNWVSSAILGDGEFGFNDPHTALNVDVRKVFPAEPGQELYTMAVASNAPLPDVGNLVMLTQGIEVREWIAQILEGRQQLEAAQSSVAELTEELAVTRATNSEKLAELEEKLAWVEEHDLYLKDLTEKSRVARTIIELWAKSRSLHRRIKRKLNS